MEALLRIGVVLLVAYGAVCLLAFLLQDRIIFYPRGVLIEPRGPHVEALTFERAGTVLRGWVVNPRARGPVLVYFGGNGEELSPLTEVFAGLDATTLLVNYRGYGRSEGTPSAAALIDDARAVTTTLAPDYGSDRPLLLFGRSLGSGIAASVAATVPVDGMILMSPFRSLEHMARRVMPWVPVRWLLRHRIDTAAAVDALPEQVLVLYAPDDGIVPAAETRALLDLFPRAPRVAQFRGGHNVPLTRVDLWPEVEAFVQRFVP